MKKITAGEIMKNKNTNEVKIRKPSLFIYTIPAYIVKFMAKISKVSKKKNQIAKAASTNW